MLGLCLVAALALGAYAVSSASALEWGKCELAGPGHNYTGPNCTKSEKAKPKGTGEYEWRKASEVAEKRVAEGKSANVPFSGGSVGSGGVLTSGDFECLAPGEPYKNQRVNRQTCAEAEGEEIDYTEELAEELLTVECEAETNSGEAEGKNKVANVNVTFTGCLLLGALPCESEGAEEGEVVTSTLKGKLGWLNKSAKEVGVVLEPAAKHGLFAFFTCYGGAFETAVGVGNKHEGTYYTSSGCSGVCPGATPEEEKHGGYDQVISPITPVNQMTSAFEQVFTINPKTAENIPNKLENKHISLLEDWVRDNLPAEPTATQWSPAGEEITNVNTPEEEGEIKA
jgi:hypothetical protein